jgi:hypothetical protein
LDAGIGPHRGNLAAEASPVILRLLRMPHPTPEDIAGVIAAEPCPTCTSAAGVGCFFDAFERLGPDGKMRDRRGGVHHLRVIAWVDSKGKQA